MSSFQEKESWTYERFGEFLAEHFKTNVLGLFDSDKDLFGFSSSFRKTKKSILLKEWVFLNMFAMFQGVSSHFRGSKEGFRVLDHFHQSCSLIFTEASLAKEPKPFIESVMSRYDIYTAALKKTSGLGPLGSLSEEFCRLCGNEYALITRVGIATHYVSFAVSCKNLMSGLLKSVHIVKSK